MEINRTTVVYELEACIVTFMEIKGNNPFFMKRKFKDEARARAFVSDLLVSDRKISNVQFKINYYVRKEEE